MAKYTDISKIGILEFKRRKAALLDDEWNKKYPEGMYYILARKIICGTEYRKAATCQIGCGRLLSRPTATKTEVQEGSARYSGAKTYNVKRFKSFKRTIFQTER